MEVISRLVAWAEKRPDIQAVVLTSSRARADETVDTLSDYDVILAVADAHAFVHDDSWQFEYGEPMVRWGDQSELDGVTTYFRGVVYADGVKIDYTLWPDELLDRVAERDVLPEDLDVGYRVLLDKEKRTAGWSAP